MKSIKGTLDIVELLNSVDIELPIEIPGWNLSLDYSDGKLTYEINYDEEIEKVTLTEEEINEWAKKTSIIFMLNQEKILAKIEEMKTQLKGGMNDEQGH